MLGNEIAIKAVIRYWIALSLSNPSPLLVTYNSKSLSATSHEEASASSASSPWLERRVEIAFNSIEIAFEGELEMNR